MTACPVECSACKEGAAWDGGKALTSAGVCEHYCSKWGFVARVKNTKRIHLLFVMGVQHQMVIISYQNLVFGIQLFLVDISNCLVLLF